MKAQHPEAPEPTQEERDLTDERGQDVCKRTLGGYAPVWGDMTAAQRRYWCALSDNIRERNRTRGDLAKHVSQPNETVSR